MRSLQHLPERVAALFQDESGGKKEMAIKKCFLGLRQTALMSAEGKNARKGLAKQD
jgi:hypothetical protein